MKKKNIITIKDNPKKRPSNHFLNLSEKEQNEILDLVEDVFFDEKKLKLCLQSIGTFSSNNGYREDEIGTHYLLEDIGELVEETFREELKYDMAQSKHLKVLLRLNKEMEKHKKEIKK